MTVSWVRLRVNPIACDAFGYCAELLPEIIGVDEWGYPTIDGVAVPARLLELAERAVRDCPRRALFLEKVAVDQGSPRAAPRSTPGKRRG